MTDPNTELGPTPTDGPTPAPDLDALREEVRAEQPKTNSRLDNLPPGCVLVELRGTELAILPHIDWPGSAGELLFQGRYFRWGQKVLAEQRDRNAWNDIDPTQPQMEDFIERAVAALGVPLETSSQSANSSGLTHADLKAI